VCGDNGEKLSFVRNVKGVEPKNVARAHRARCKIEIGFELSNLGNVENSRFLRVFSFGIA
jgi:hypothetical protein